MKHCWHPTGASAHDTFGGADQLRCCWCGTFGTQRFEDERALTSGHGSYYVKLVKVRRPVQGETEECTGVRENQKLRVPGDTQKP